ncbi:MAG: hypothetical protein M0P12_01165 [Paludibacteraceae bacterium]|nr:hypothetical protein [Paludibacteraceae bacterium]MCK9615544.1 hypothetical protein [Candidatus Omnitrophota bacterium]
MDKDMASLKITNDLRKDIINLINDNILLINDIRFELFVSLKEIRKSLETEDEKESLLTSAEGHEERLSNLYCLTQNLSYHKYFLENRKETDAEAESVLKWYDRVKSILKEGQSP